MKFKMIGSGIAALALLATSFSAEAADIPRPVYKGVRSVIAYYNWTGFYAGINAGYGWGTSDWSLGPLATAVSNSPKGFLVGGTLGYNYQTGSFVWGLEGDIAWSDVNGSVNCGLGLTCETANRWFGTARGRLGYAFDRFMPYVTGGAAFGEVAGQRQPGAAVQRERHAGRLDVRRRPRIRLPRQLDRQDRIPLRRSRQLRHRLHRTDPERGLLQGERCPRRPELQVLRPDLHPVVSAADS